MPALTLPTPTPDELDDLVYYSRTSDIPSLRASIAQLCTTHSCAPSVLLASAIDIDADGLGSQNCLLHYPSANGDVETTKYLLSLLLPSEVAGEVGGTTVDKSAPALVNHRNVSGNTPLHWAAVNGCLEVVKLLVEQGADPGVRNEVGRDVLVETEMMGSKDGCKEVVQWLEGSWKGLEEVVGGEGAGERPGEEVEAEDGTEEVVAESVVEQEEATPTA